MKKSMWQKLGKDQRGITLVETLITIALTVLVFVSVMMAVQYAVRLASESSTRLIAMSLATERLEYLRSLSYNDVGTVSGFPAGIIPQNSIHERDGVRFTERVLVDYVDDPADGLAGSDTNSIITDYKKVKLELLWTKDGFTDSVSYVTNIVPVSVETNVGGGAINIEVRDASGSSLEDALVQVTNVAKGIDITRSTGPNGVASFIVPAGSEYHASATKAGYSIDRTYYSTVQNPSPSPGSFTVVESLITDQGFQIGVLSDLNIKAFSSIMEASSTVAFNDLTEIATGSDVSITAGELRLNEVSGVYQTSGTATLPQINPGSLVRWESAVVVGVTNPNTDFRVRFYSGTNTTYELVEEAVLPGNAVGFNQRIIDLSNLSVSTYPDLTLELILTGDTTASPQINDVAVYYRESEVTRPTTNLTVRSRKAIGTNGASTVYKYDNNHATDANGEINLLEMEFDSEYKVFNNNNLKLARACSNAKLDYSQSDVLLDHQAGIATELELLYQGAGTENLLVVIQSDSLEPLPGAVVTLSRSGFSETVFTDTCGQAFFGATGGAEADYLLSVDRVGYVGYSKSNFTISGNTRHKVILTEI